MFDPFHNAVDQYDLVNGPLKVRGRASYPTSSSPTGTSARHESLKWFANRGHPQVIAGYYDVDDLSGFTDRDRVARSLGVPNVIGFMYTTWQARYDLLEAYGEALRGGR